MYAGNVSQTSILAYYKPDWPFDLATETLYGVINQAVGFCIQDSVECSQGLGIPGLFPQL